jgi:hypothetical protein
MSIGRSKPLVSAPGATVRDLGSSDLHDEKLAEFPKFRNRSCCNNVATPGKFIKLIKGGIIDTSLPYFLIQAIF